MKRLTLMILGVCLAGASAAPELKPRVIRVMVIDTGIAEIDKYKEFLATSNDKKELVDTHGHGTHITGLILYGPTLKDKVCSEVKIYGCKFFGPDSHDTSECFDKARDLEIDVINFSGGGPEYKKDEDESIKKFKGKMVVAAGNSEYNSKGELVRAAWDISKAPYYPASLNYSNMTVVGNGVSSETRSGSSNFGLPNMKWRNGQNIKSYDSKGYITFMSGTSQATAIYTHEVVKELCQRLAASAK